MKQLGIRPICMRDTFFTTIEGYKMNKVLPNVITDPVLFVYQNISVRVSNSTVCLCSSLPTVGS